MNKIGILILILVLLNFEVSYSARRCENSLFAEFGLSPQFVSSFSKRSKNQTEYLAKKKFYTSDSIYRGFLREGKLTLEKAVKFVLKIDADLAGNGVSTRANGITRAILDYNEKAKDKVAFLKNYSEHLRGTSDQYWKSLLTSWSSSKEGGVAFSRPENDELLYDNAPESAFGVFVTAARPKLSLEATAMETQFQTTNPWPLETEVSVPVAMDPQMISKITFLQYEKEGTRLARSTETVCIQIEQLSYGVYSVRVGTSNTALLQDGLEAMTVSKEYRLKIKPDSSYVLDPI